MQLAAPESRLQMQQERRRLGQVRKAFAAGVDTKTAGGDVALEFFAACVDYIGAAMDRLHAQDQRIHDLLAPHVPAGDAENQATLGHLNARLAASRGALNRLTKGFEVFRRGGGKEWAIFAGVVADFMDVYINTLLKGQHSTQALQDTRFGVAEWNQVADINNEALKVDGALFTAVCRLAPKGANPAEFQGGPPARG